MNHLKCALSLLQYTHWYCSKASNLCQVAFHSQRINLVLPWSPPIFCRSSHFCSEMTNGRFSLFGFYSRWSSTPMVIGKIGPISEMGCCSQFSTRTQPTTPLLLMATLIFYFFYFITTTSPLLLMPTNAYFSHFPPYSFVKLLRFAFSSRHQNWSHYDLMDSRWDFIWILLKTLLHLPEGDPRELRAVSGREYWMRTWGFCQLIRR